MLLTLTAGGRPTVVAVGASVTLDDGVVLTVDADTPDGYAVTVENPARHLYDRTGQYRAPPMQPANRPGCGCRPRASRTTATGTAPVIYPSCGETPRAAPGPQAPRARWTGPPGIRLLDTTNR